MSLLLHALLCIALTAIFERPRDVVWVDLLEARLIPPRKEQTSATLTPSAPAPAPVPIQPRPRVTSHSMPRPSASLPVKPVVPRTSSEEAPLQTEAAIAPRQTSPALEHGLRTPPAAPLQAAAITTPSSAAPAAVETPERRYLREQYDYIRGRITSRLNYPAMARRQGWSGQVTLTFLVQPDGRIANLEVTRSSGHPVLDRQAMQAVIAATPFPAPPAPAVITLPVTFTLELSGH